jgi:hypothetical protein
MSLANLSVIMGRIKTATEKSPIAVFKSTVEGYREDGMLDAVFGDTVRTTARIKSGDPDYIGSYCQDMDLIKVKSSLRMYV